MTNQSNQSNKSSPAKLPMFKMIFFSGYIYKEWQIKSNQSLKNTTQIDIRNDHMRIHSSGLHWITPLPSVSKRLVNLASWRDHRDMLR